MGDSRVLHLCVENDALVTNGLRLNFLNLALKFFTEQANLITHEEITATKALLQLL